MNTNQLKEILDTLMDCNSYVVHYSKDTYGILYENYTDFNIINTVDLYHTILS